MASVGNISAGTGSGSGNSNDFFRQDDLPQYPSSSVDAQGVSQAAAENASPEVNDVSPMVSPQDVSDQMVSEGQATLQSATESGDNESNANALDAPESIWWKNELERLEFIDFLQK